MGGGEINLVNGWVIHDPRKYFALVCFFAVIVRLLMSLLRAAEPNPPKPLPPSFWRRMCWFFRGFYTFPSQHAAGTPKDWETDYWHPDYLHPFVLGLLELSAYPVLMTAGAWNVIGAWYGLKTLSQWQQWKSSRASFNRFLIGNALVLMVGFWLAWMGYVSLV
jgi:hypothetical protein